MKTILIIAAFFCSVVLQAQDLPPTDASALELQRSMAVFDRKIEKYLHSKIVRSEPARIRKLELPAGFGSISYILKTGEFQNGAICSMAAIRSRRTSFPVVCKIGKGALVAVGALFSKKEIVFNANINQTDDLYTWGLFKILREMRINELRSRFEAFSESAVHKCLKSNFELRLNMLLYVTHSYHEDYTSYAVFRAHGREEIDQLDRAMAQKLDLRPFIKIFPECESLPPYQIEKK